MLITAPYPVPVSTVCPQGQLAIPDLPWVPGVVPLVVSDGKSFAGMFTNVGNKGYGSTLAHYLPHVTSSGSLTASDLHALETGILNDIQTVLSAGPPYHSHSLLQHIAVGIHLWGGNAGRNAFIMGGGFSANCPMHDYAAMVNLLMTHPRGVPIPAGNWPAIEAMEKRFYQFNVSFLTKHLAFWSRAAASPLGLPILDRVIFQTFVSPERTPLWKDYVPYVAALERDRAIIAGSPGLAGISILTMERQLFNWANSSAAKSWNR